MLRLVILGLVLCVLLSCGSERRSSGYDIQLPRILPPREAPKEPLSELAGYYDLVQLDGQEKLAGYVAVIFDDQNVGFTIDPYLTAENPAPRHRWLTANEKTRIEFRGNQIIQTSQSGSETVEIIYERTIKELLISGRRCIGENCTSLNCRARKPD